MMTQDTSASACAAASAVAARVRRVRSNPEKLRLGASARALIGANAVVAGGADSVGALTAIARSAARLLALFMSATVVGNRVKAIEA